MKTEVLVSRTMHADDTTVPVLDKDSEVNEDRAAVGVLVGDGAHKHIVFDYTPDRSRDGPLRFLQGYKGLSPS
jgi:transposase